jgi:pantoate--beta-alanine ligase
MKIIRSIKTLQRLLAKEKRNKRSIGFVPTMGALHEGHLSLVRRSKKENHLTVVSIFVNPKQFGPKEDFRQYPREEMKDKYFLQNEIVDIVFYPSAEEIYPMGYSTYVEVEGYSKVMDGVIRPGHFKGVTTVVCKLLNIVGPSALYLGAKDAQQAVILSKMVKDLNVPVTVKVCPTVREKDGLAMSSRNIYLTAQERQEAPILYQALRQAKHMIGQGILQTKKIKQEMSRLITAQSSGKINYIECVNAHNLSPVNYIEKKTLIALSVQFGRAKLIDNITVNA